ncbi:MAG: histone deacetylase [Candidatus Altiarchaeota archaeon]
MMETGIIYHEDYLKHRQIQQHPECPERLLCTMDYFRRKEILDPFNGMKTKILDTARLIRPDPALVEDITRVHSIEHVNYIRCLSEGGPGLFSIIDSDTYVCKETYDTALLAAGGVITSGEMVWNGELKNSFALVRPPGHHASVNQATGFCYFDNVSIMIKYMQEKYGVKKVFLFDWDAHAPNGTMGTFYSDPSVLNMSIHQDPHSFYPGVGFVHQIGEGAGRGYTINFPVQAGTGDADYMYFLEEFVIPRAKKFKPDLVVVSAGQDSHQSDRISQLNVTDAGFAAMTRAMMELASDVCNDKLVLELEGGYNLQTLPVTNHVIASTLAGFEYGEDVEGEVMKSTVDLLEELEDNLKASRIWAEAPDYGESEAAGPDKKCRI